MECGAETSGSCAHRRSYQRAVPGPGGSGGASATAQPHYPAMRAPRWVAGMFVAQQEGLAVAGLKTGCLQFVPRHQFSSTYRQSAVSPSRLRRVLQREVWPGVCQEEQADPGAARVFEFVQLMVLPIPPGWGHQGNKLPLY